MLDERVKYLIEHDTKDYLELLQLVGGYYECPRNAAGKRIGPLVGYAGRDKQGRQFVGDVYANFAKAEEYPVILGYLAGRLTHFFFRGDYPLYDSIDVYCGAPMGGITLAFTLALREEIRGCRFVFPDKKVSQAATVDSREVSELVWGRHEINAGDKVAIVEDVANNFSTTDKLVDLVETSGSKVVALMCLLNRSLTVTTEYRTQDGFSIPVISLVRKPIPQYVQDDPEVIEDILRSNVIWKPKDEWPLLMKAMEEVKK